MSEMLELFTLSNTSIENSQIEAGVLIVGVSNYHIALHPIRASFLLICCLGELFKDILILNIEKTFRQ